MAIWRQKPNRRFVEEMQFRKGLGLCETFSEPSSTPVSRVIRISLSALKRNTALLTYLIYLIVLIYQYHKCSETNNLLIFEGDLLCSAVGHREAQEVISVGHRRGLA